MKKEELKSPNPEWSRFRDDLEYMGENYNPTFEDIIALVNCKSFDQLTGFWAELGEKLFAERYS